MLQPILENALNYGIRELDDFGEIVVGGQKVGEDIIITVSDNGMGIPENEIPLLLTNLENFLTFLAVQSGFVQCSVFTPLFLLTNMRVG